MYRYPPLPTTAPTADADAAAAELAAALAEALALLLLPLPPLLLLPPPLALPFAFALPARALPTAAAGGLVELALLLPLAGEDALLLLEVEVAAAAAARADLLLLAFCVEGCLLPPADWCVAAEEDGRLLLESLAALEAGAAEESLTGFEGSCKVG